MKVKLFFMLLSVALLASSCSIVKQGEVGVKRKLGRLNPTVIQPGPVVFNPFIARIIKMPIRTVNVEIAANLPSKEGLNVAAVISILYRIQPEKAPGILENIGVNYEEIMISSVFRSAAADVCSRFLPKICTPRSGQVLSVKLPNRWRKYWFRADSTFKLSC